MTQYATSRRSWPVGRRHPSLCRDPADRRQFERSAALKRLPSRSPAIGYRRYATSSWKTIAFWRDQMACSRATTRQPRDARERDDGRNASTAVRDQSARPRNTASHCANIERGQRQHAHGEKFPASRIAPPAGEADPFRAPIAGLRQGGDVRMINRACSRISCDRGINFVRAAADRVRAARKLFSRRHSTCSRSAVRDTTADCFSPWGARGQQVDGCKALLRIVPGR
jgi:hypothetical protein